MKVLVATFAFNEGEKIKRVVKRHPKTRNYDLLVMDDGSKDNSTKSFSKSVLILKNQTNRGIGYSMKRVFQYAIDKKYEILVIQAGNNKDDPLEIPKLIRPILDGTADFVQGSRYCRRENKISLPWYRFFATRYVHPLIFSLLVGKKVTESTNGFRAFKTVILKDKEINWRQEWLDKYELEPYLLFKVIKLGYKHLEVPVSKYYPPKEQGYSKMRPFIDWWSITKPVFLLSLGIRK
jgi:dolichol-phosphate mannosyltransferase